jgi:hypothetical protein
MAARLDGVLQGLLRTHLTTKAAHLLAFLT